MLLTLFNMFGAAAAAVITVTGGENIFHDVSNGNTATARIRVDKDGNIYKTEGITNTQLATGTDWIRPISDDDNLYECKFTKGILDDNTTGGETLDTWVFITVDRLVEYVESTNDTELTGTITVHIRYNGGATLDTGALPMRARVGTPI